MSISLPSYPDPTETPVPLDDLDRELTLTRLDDSSKKKVVSVVGDTYTILVSGADTDGRYCLIDMLVPDGSGPPPHRHNFEEMFSLLEGELEFTFRGKTTTVKAPSTVNIPANAPHQFKNASGTTVHMLCMCSPAGQDDFFLRVGVMMESRDSPPPKLNKDEIAAKGKLAEELSPQYGTEMLKSA